MLLDIIEMRRTVMNTITKQQRLDSYIRLAQEWKLSGMTQVEFALSKGMTVRAFEYRIRRVRDEAPESLDESALRDIEFTPVPKEYLDLQTMNGRLENTESQPVMMIQSSAASLQVTNQIAPHLLKAALEVILSC